ncbi:CheR family methyltransferase [Virgibacillus sp. MG-45]|uniref:CheR family methyltransferase n=1 Tax=Virgibacillus sp. MG-45 TaxID=3102791 RepID=UPI002ED98801
MGDYEKFISLINSKLGIDLALYKEAQMKRRLTSLRSKRGYNDFESYFRALDKDDELLKEFVDRITINVSEFYRNPKRWDVLRDTILPMITKENSSITIWSAACSTGEEPYTLAMLMKEYFPQVSAKIIATDIDINALSKAKEGVYNEQALKDLPTPLKKKYFTFENMLYKVSPSLKSGIIFKQHNLLKDAYPKDVHLIVCRNVLIYFTDTAKNEIYQNFSKSLHKDGVLFVGSTEQIFNPDRYDFKLLDTFFYGKQN